MICLSLPHIYLTSLTAEFSSALVGEERLKKKKKNTICTPAIACDDDDASSRMKDLLHMGCNYRLCDESADPYSALMTVSSASECTSYDDRTSLCRHTLKPLRLSTYKTIISIVVHLLLKIRLRPRERKVQKKS